MIMDIIARIEEERALNRKMLQSLHERLDAMKADLSEEFQERDASLLALIEGTPQASPRPQALKKGAPDADVNS